jgi:hypothetical protein
MPSGIYMLEFETGARYIGKSVDIRARWKQHADKLQKGTAAKPMMDAFQKSGYDLPTGYILLECHPDMLDEYEGMYINLNTPELNTSIPPRRTDLEYEWLKQHAELGEAIHSTPAVIATMNRKHRELEQANGAIEGLNMQVRKLVGTLDDKIEIESLAFDGYQDTVTERNDLRGEVRSLKKKCEDLWAWKQQVKKLGWWNRLWANWPV